MKIRQTEAPKQLKYLISEIIHFLCSSLKASKAVEIPVTGDLGSQLVTI